MPGWPKYFSNVTYNLDYQSSAGISFADINGDDDLEVIVNFRYSDGDTLFVFDYQGNLLWKHRDNLIRFPAFADLDNDGVNEIIFGSASGLNVLKGDGSPMPNFPFSISNDWSEVAIADVDGDDSLDIVFFAQRRYATAHLYIFNRRAEPLPGWPRVMPDFWFLHPGVADIDNDSKKEIVYNTWSDSLYCFRYDGTLQPGFPVENRFAEDWTNVSEVILCDVDNDNYSEIIIGSATLSADTGCLYIYRWDGSYQPGWPKSFSNHIVFAPLWYHFAVGDIDNDQEIEIVVGLGRPLRILNCSGNYLPGACEWHSLGAQNPVIANIDFTPEKEIIAQSTKHRISAYYHNGEMCYGWPVKMVTQDINNFNNVTVDDIDNDGLIELGILMTTYVYIWKLHGRPEDIEWGRPYYDLQRTCHYKRQR